MPWPLLLVLLITSNVQARVVTRHGVGVRPQVGLQPGVAAQSTGGLSPRGNHRLVYSRGISASRPAAGAPPLVRLPGLSPGLQQNTQNTGRRQVPTRMLAARPLNVYKSNQHFQQRLASVKGIPQGPQNLQVLGSHQQMGTGNKGLTNGLQIQPMNYPQGVRRGKNERLQITTSSYIKRSGGIQLSGIKRIDKRQDGSNSNYVPLSSGHVSSRQPYQQKSQKPFLNPQQLGIANRHQLRRGEMINKDVHPGSTLGNIHEERVANHQPIQQGQRQYHNIPVPNRRNGIQPSRIINLNSNHREMINSNSVRTVNYQIIPNGYLTKQPVRMRSVVQIHQNPGNTNGIHHFQNQRKLSYNVPPVFQNNGRLNAARAARQKAVVCLPVGCKVSGFLQRRTNDPRFQAVFDRNQVNIQQLNMKNSVNLQGANMKSSVNLQRANMQNTVNLQRANMINAVNLQGANMKNNVNLQGANVKNTVNLQNANMKNGVNLQGANMKNTVNLQGANMKNNVNLQGANMKNNVNLQNANMKNAVNLQGANMKNTVNLQGANMKNRVNLQGANIKNAVHLQGANMKNAVNLQGAIIKNTVHLQGANMKNAVNLQGVNIKNAVNLQGANMKNAVNVQRANMKNAVNLQRANMKNRANLQRANIKNSVNLQRANTNTVNLQRANIKNSVNLQRANMNSMKLQRANMNSVNVQRANTNSVNVQRANMNSVNVQRANMNSMKLQRANMNSVNLQRANMNRVNVQRANMNSMKLQRANMNSMKLQRANMNSVNVQRANMNSVNVQGANMNRVNLQGASIKNTVNLQRAKMNSVNVQGANMNRVNLQGASIKNTVNLQRAKMNSVNVQGANMNRVNLQGASIKNTVNLQRAKMNSVNVQGANMNKVNLQGASIKNTVNLQRAKMNSVYLQGANMNSVNLQRANMVNGNLYRRISQIQPQPLLNNIRRPVNPNNRIRTPGLYRPVSLNIPQTVISNHLISKQRQRIRQTPYVNQLPRNVISLQNKGSLLQRPQIFPNRRYVSSRQHGLSSEGYQVSPLEHKQFLKPYLPSLHRGVPSQNYQAASLQLQVPLGQHKLPLSQTMSSSLPKSGSSKFQMALQKYQQPSPQPHIPSEQHKLFTLKNKLLSNQKTDSSQASSMKQPSTANQTRFVKNKYEENLDTSTKKDILSKEQYRIQTNAKLQPGKYSKQDLHKPAVYTKHSKPQIINTKTSTNVGNHLPNMNAAMKNKLPGYEGHVQSQMSDLKQAVENEARTLPNVNHIPYNTKDIAHGNNTSGQITVKKDNASIAYAPLTNDLEQPISVDQNQDSEPKKPYNKQHNHEVTMARTSSERVTMDSGQNNVYNKPDKIPHRKPSDGLQTNIVSSENNVYNKPDKIPHRKPSDGLQTNIVSSENNVYNKPDKIPHRKPSDGLQTNIVSSENNVYNKPDKISHRKPSDELQTNIVSSENNVYNKPDKIPHRTPSDELQTNIVSSENNVYNKPDKIPHRKPSDELQTNIVSSESLYEKHHKQHEMMPTRKTAYRLPSPNTHLVKSIKKVQHILNLIRSKAHKIQSRVTVSINNSVLSNTRRINTIGITERNTSSLAERRQAQNAVTSDHQLVETSTPTLVDISAFNVTTHLPSNQNHNDDAGNTVPRTYNETQIHNLQLKLKNLISEHLRRQKNLKVANHMNRWNKISKVSSIGDSIPNKTLDSQLIQGVSNAVFSHVTYSTQDIEIKSYTQETMTSTTDNVVMETPTTSIPAPDRHHLAHATKHRLLDIMRASPVLKWLLPRSNATTAQPNNLTIVHMLNEINSSANAIFAKRTNVTQRNITRASEIKPGIETNISVKHNSAFNVSTVQTTKVTAKGTIVSIASTTTVPTQERHHLAEHTKHKLLNLLRASPVLKWLLPQSSGTSTNSLSHPTNLTVHHMLTEINSRAKAIFAKQNNLHKTSAMSSKPQINPGNVTQNIKLDETEFRTGIPVPTSVFKDNIHNMHETISVGNVPIESTIRNASFDTYSDSSSKRFSYNKTNLNKILQPVNTFKINHSLKNISNTVHNLDNTQQENRQLSYDNNSKKLKTYVHKSAADKGLNNVHQTIQTSTDIHRLHNFQQSLQTSTDMYRLSNLQQSLQTSTGDDGLETIKETVQMANNNTGSNTLVPSSHTSNTNVMSVQRQRLTTQKVPNIFLNNNTSLTTSYEKTKVTTTKTYQKEDNQLRNSHQYGKIEYSEMNTTAYSLPDINQLHSRMKEKTADPTVSANPDVNQFSERLDQNDINLNSVVHGTSRMEHNTETQNTSHFTVLNQRHNDSNQVHVTLFKSNNSSHTSNDVQGETTKTNLLTLKPTDTTIKIGEHLTEVYLHPATTIQATTQAPSVVQKEQANNESEDTVYETQLSAPTMTSDTAVSPSDGIITSAQNSVPFPTDEEYATNRPYPRTQHLNGFLSQLVKNMHPASNNTVGMVTELPSSSSSTLAGSIYTLLDAPWTKSDWYNFGLISYYQSPVPHRYTRLGERDNYGSHPDSVPEALGSTTSYTPLYMSGTTTADGLSNRPVTDTHKENENTKFVEFVDSKTPSVHTKVSETVTDDIISKQTTDKHGRNTTQYNDVSSSHSNKSIQSNANGYHQPKLDQSYTQIPRDSMKTPFIIHNSSSVLSIPREAHSGDETTLTDNTNSKSVNIVRSRPFRNGSTTLAISNNSISDMFPHTYDVNDQGVGTDSMQIKHNIIQSKDGQQSVSLPQERTSIEKLSTPKYHLTTSLKPSTIKPYTKDNSVTSAIQPHSENQVIKPTVQSYPEKVDTSTTKPHSENQVIKPIVQSYPEKVDTSTIKPHSENQVIKPTVQSYPEKVDTSTTKPHSENQVIKPIVESYPEKVDTSTIKPHSENQVIKPTTQSYPEKVDTSTTKPHSENQVIKPIVQSYPEKVDTSTIKPHSENQVIKPTVQSYPEKFDTSTIKQYMENHVVTPSIKPQIESHIIAPRIKPYIENQITTPSIESYPEKAVTSAVKPHMENHFPIATIKPYIENHVVISTIKPYIENNVVISTVKPYIQKSDTLRIKPYTENHLVTSSIKSHMENHVIIPTIKPNLENHFISTIKPHMENHVIIPTIKPNLENHVIPTIKPHMENHVIIPTIKPNMENHVIPTIKPHIENHAVKPTIKQSIEKADTSTIKPYTKNHFVTQTIKPYTENEDVKQTTKLYPEKAVAPMIKPIMKKHIATSTIKSHIDSHIVHPTIEPYIENQVIKATIKSTVKPHVKETVTLTMQPSTEKVGSIIKPLIKKIISSVKELSEVILTTKPSTEVTSTIKPYTEVTLTIKPSTEVTSTIKPYTEVTSTIKPSTEVTLTIKPSTEVTLTTKPSTEVTLTTKPYTEVTSTIKLSTEKITHKTKASLEKITSTIKPSTEVISTMKQSIKTVISTIKLSPEKVTSTIPSTEVILTRKPSIAKVTSTIQPSTKETSTIKLSTEKVASPVKPPIHVISTIQLSTQVTSTIPSKEVTSTRIFNKTTSIIKTSNKGTLIVKPHSAKFASTIKPYSEKVTSTVLQHYENQVITSTQSSLESGDPKANQWGNTENIVNVMKVLLTNFHIIPKPDADINAIIDLSEKLQHGHNSSLASEPERVSSVKEKETVDKRIGINDSTSRITSTDYVSNTAITRSQITIPLAEQKHQTGSRFGNQEENRTAPANPHFVKSHVSVVGTYQVPTSYENTLIGPGPHSTESTPESHPVYTSTIVNRTGVQNGNSHPVTSYPAFEYSSPQSSDKSYLITAQSSSGQVVGNTPKPVTVNGAQGLKKPHYRGDGTNPQDALIEPVLDQDVIAVRKQLPYISGTQNASKVLMKISNTSNALDVVTKETTSSSLRTGEVHSEISGTTNDLGFAKASAEFVETPHSDVVRIVTELPVTIRPSFFTHSSEQPHGYHHQQNQQVRQQPNQQQRQQSNQHQNQQQTRQQPNQQQTRQQSNQQHQNHQQLDQKQPNNQHQLQPNEQNQQQWQQQTNQFESVASVSQYDRHAPYNTHDGYQVQSTSPCLQSETLECGPDARFLRSSRRKHLRSLCKNRCDVNGICDTRLCSCTCIQNKLPLNNNPQKSYLRREEHRIMSQSGNSPDSRDAYSGYPERQSSRMNSNPNRRHLEATPVNYRPSDNQRSSASNGKQFPMNTMENQYNHHRSSSRRRGQVSSIRDNELNDIGYNHWSSHDRLSSRRRHHHRSNIDSYRNDYITQDMHGPNIRPPLRTTQGRIHRKNPRVRAKVKTTAAPVTQTVTKVAVTTTGKASASEGEEPTEAPDNEAVEEEEV